jgi:TrpR-related protein YerC/YecD
MPKVSKIKVDAANLNFFLNNFWSVVTLLEDKEQVKDFLKSLLTHTEMKMLAKRIQIAKMLLEEYKYKDIRGYVRVTDPTISRISNILENNGKGLKIAIKYLQKIETEADQKRMNISSSIKKKYSIYFLPEKILAHTQSKLKRSQKRNSVK